jgi:hypothetical protein
MRSLMLALIAALLGATSYAESPQFVLSSRDRANLLAVDFIAVSPDGTPVETLVPADVTVRLGGRTRRVVSLDFVRAQTRGATSVAAPYGDNVSPLAPRSLILMVDADTIRPGRTATVRDAAQQLLTGLAPDDRVALVTVPFGGLAVDLTTEHQRVLTALNGLTAQSARGETVADAQCRTLTTLDAMSDMLLRLSVVEDPVTVVLFSSHQAGPQNMIRMTGEASAGGACELRASHFTDLGHAVARARARVYVVHADLEQRSRGLEGLEHLSGVTGGPLLHLSTDNGRAAVGRILTETSGHYVVRITRDPSDTTDQVQNIGIATTRSGVTVWRAPQFLVTRASAAAATSKSAPTSVIDLMRQPRLATDLPLRVTAHTFRDDDEGKVRLAVTLDSPDSAAALSSAMIGVFDARGQLVTGLEMTAEALTRRPVVAALSVPPGTYRLRAAALESSGRGGTADQTIEAALTPIGAVSASSVMIGLSREGGFVPALEFSGEPTAFGMLELYGAVSPAPRVVFEIATTTNGPAVLTMPGLVEGAPVPTRAVVTAVLPISQLSPGDYVVRVTITPEGRAGGRVIRTLRKISVQPVKEPTH